YGARNPDRFVRKINTVQTGASARRIALVENEIEDVQHRVESLSALTLVGSAKTIAGFFDELFGAAVPLRHRRLGHEKGMCDFSTGEATDRAQRQCNRGRASERRMATHEEEQQGIVLLRLIGHLLLHEEVILATLSGAFGSEMISDPAGRNLDQPG